MKDKIIVWKDGTYKLESSPTWEYENDEDWLVTIDLKNLKENETENNNP